MGGRGFYFLDKQRSGRKCLVSGSDRQIFCSTEMFNKEMLCEFVLSIGGLGGGWFPVAELEPSGKRSAGLC